MRTALMALTLIISTSGGLVMADDSMKQAMLEDHLLYSAKSEEEILSWARGKSRVISIERFDYADRAL